MLTLFFSFLYLVKDWTDSEFLQWSNWLFTKVAVRGGEVTKGVCLGGRVVYICDIKDLLLASKCP